MAKILENISRTFNEFLLLPNLTDERCIPSNVSLKTPLVKLSLIHIYINIDKFGNTFCASIPIALDEMMRKKIIKPGDKIILLGYGGALNTASILIEI